MARRSPPRKVTYFEPVPPRLARNTIIESTFEVGRRFSCTMRVDCGQLDPGAVIRPVPGQWRPRMPERLDEEELADWRAGRNAVYQLAALTIGRASLSPTRKPSLKGLSGATRRLIRRRRRWSLKAFRQGVSGAKTDRAQPALPRRSPPCGRLGAVRGRRYAFFNHSAARWCTNQPGTRHARRSSAPFLTVAVNRRGCAASRCRLSGAFSR
jgi:hypothetical protein